MVSTSVGQRSRVVYVSGVAQHENLGDLVIRRRYLEWFDLCRVRLLVAGMPAPYIQALTHHLDVELVHTKGQWLREILAGREGRNTVLAFSPGAYTIAGYAGLSRAAHSLAATSVVKVQRGKVVNIGRSLEGKGRIATVLERVTTQLADTTAVRDGATQQRLGASPRVATMPDLALAGPAASMRAPGSPYVAVSPRNGGVLSSGSNCTQLLDLFTGSDFRPLVVSQVQRDDPNVEDLSVKLRAQKVAWGRHSHLEQLDRVEDAYRRCSLVISDRLHSLLFGMMSGAIPVAMDSDRHGKVARQMQELGLANLTFVPSEREDLRTHVRESARCAAQVDDARRRAFSRLGQLKSDLHAAMQLGERREG